MAPSILPCRWKCFELFGAAADSALLFKHRFAPSEFVRPTLSFYAKTQHCPPNFSFHLAHHIPSFQLRSGSSIGSSTTFFTLLTPTHGTTLLSATAATLHTPSNEPIVHCNSIPVPTRQTQSLLSRLFSSPTHGFELFFVSSSSLFTTLFQARDSDNEDAGHDSQMI